MCPPQRSQRLIGLYGMVLDKLVRYSRALGVEESQLPCLVETVGLQLFDH